MPYRSLTIQEVARMLGTDLRRVERMAQRREIPCQKVGGQYRFNRAQITEWLQQEMGSMSHDHLAEVDAGMTSHRETGENEAIVAPLLNPQAVTTSLGSRTKDSTLRELVSMAVATGKVYNEQELLDAVMHREELCSTAMEGGIAIPHPRRPLPDAIAEPILVIARTQGIAFGAPDGRLTQLFLLIASQDDRHHLHILARLCRMLHDEKFIDRLQEAQTSAEIIELMTLRENQVLNE
ncbi:MAG TPA: PTS sugar transporter subunit IIA [Sedimentisphaerales bacterium]|nr:PTS sugar transporter subunit IIA [Sedimentisphaerales bacterium]HQG49207.1 PTS sugar transporter subunit IIA [Sedimentisphaerales bacterium]